MAGGIGKIVGGALGLIAGGPVGALVGVLIGHQYDASGDAGGSAGGEAGGEAGAARVQALFLPASFRLMGHVAKSDGRVTEQEIDAARGMMRALRLNSAQIRQAMDCYTQGKQPGFAVAQELRQLRDALSAYPQLAQFFIELQLQAALAGNGLAAQPRERVRYAAQQLGLSGAHFQQLESLLRWRQSAQAGGYSAGAGWSTRPNAGGEALERERLAAAYSLLEARPGDSDEQVVKSYRRQMSRHHPDKLQANGLPEAMLERAKERTQQIQQAYELIRAARGMS
jgi:DnaJ like chaperone protein